MAGGGYLGRESGHRCGSGPGLLPRVAANYLLGAIVGVVYLRMLGRGVAELGKSRSRLGVTRLALFVGLIVLATQVKSLQILPIFWGS